jgi:hypothetical protein
MRRRTLRRRAAFAAALAAIAGGVAASTSLSAGPSGSGTATSAAGSPSTVVGGPAEARRAAAAQTLALPAGGNFNGIRWEEAGGTFTEADVAFVTEYNATCQWWRALSDGRDAQRAARIVQEAPTWPAITGTEPAAGLLAAAREVLAGGFGPAALALVAQCQASHEREVAWATQLGLPPSS